MSSDVSSAKRIVMANRERRELAIGEVAAVGVYWHHFVRMTRGKTKEAQLRFES